MNSEIDFIKIEELPQKLLLEKIILFLGVLWLNEG